MADLLRRRLESEASIAHLPEAVECANRDRFAAQKAAASCAADVADAEHEAQAQTIRRNIEAALAEGQPWEVVRLQFDMSGREFETYSPRVGG